MKRTQWLAFIGVTTVLFLSVTGESAAQGIPVYDNAQNLNQLQEIAHMVEQLQQMQQQLDAQLDGNAAIMGSRDMGSFLNSGLESDMRHYAPDELQDLLNIMNTGGLPSSTAGVKGSYFGLQNDYRPLTTMEVNPHDPNYPTTKAYARRVNTTFAAMAASEGAYDNAAKRTQTYESMLEELNNTPDMKASIDLQTRANIENGIVLNELTRLMSLQMQLLAAGSNQELAIRREGYDANQ